MHFRGSLSVPDQPGNGLAVDLAIDDRHLLVTSGGENLGHYPLNQTQVERLTGDRFRLTIGNEVLYFHADDALGFSYEGMPAIEGTAHSTARTLREFWRRSRSAGPKVPPGVSRPLDADRVPAHSPVSMIETLTPVPVSDLEHRPATVPPPAPPPPSPTPSITPTPTPAPAPAPAPVEPVPQVEVEEVSEVVDLPAVEAADLAQVEEKPELRPAAPSFLEQRSVECKGRRADGNPCGSMAVGSSGFCFAHDPDLAGERRLMTDRVSRTVSRARATDPDLESMVTRLEMAVIQVQDGTLDPQQALAMASLVQAMCDTIGVSRSQD